MITWRKEDSNGKLYMSMWLYMIVHCTVHFRSTSTINTSVKKKLVEEILATPNCSYSEDEVKGLLHCFFHNHACIESVTNHTRIKSVNCVSPVLQFSCHIHSQMP